MDDRVIPYNMGKPYRAIQISMDRLAYRAITMKCNADVDHKCTQYQEEVQNLQLSIL